jgi:DNA-binding beta-propeller fold protein YncE
MRVQPALLLLFCGLGGTLFPAEPTPSPALLVLSKSDLTLAIVDPSTLKVVARMPSGPDPHEVAASADGRFAYISNYGFGAYNTITVVDLAAQKTLRTIDLGPLHGPHGLDFAGGKLYFTAEANKVIGSYDPATERIDWIMGTGQDRTHMVWVSPNLNRIVTSNVSSATMSILDKTVGGGPGRGGRGPGGPPMPNWAETLIPVGRGAEGFDVSPDFREIWAANAQDGTVSVIDLASRKVATTLSIDVKGANRLKFTPDGKRVLISCLGGPDLVILDAASRTVIKRLKIGTGAAGIQMQPDGARAYVACTPDNSVAVVDLKTLIITDRFDAGGGPDGLAWVVRN